MIFASIEIEAEDIFHRAPDDLLIREAGQLAEPRPQPMIRPSLSQTKKAALGAEVVVVQQLEQEAEHRIEHPWYVAEPGRALVRGRPVAAVRADEQMSHQNREGSPRH